MSLATPAFLIPERRLPDGSLEWGTFDGSAGELLRRLREYDPDLSLVMNTAKGRWEIWLTGADRKARFTGLKLDGLDRLPNADQMLATIRANDWRYKDDPIGDLLAEEDRIEQARRRDFEDSQDEPADKLHHALAKDLSAHAPAARPIPLGGR